MLLDHKSLGAKHKKLNILVLCTGNSARSIMAETLFNVEGAPYFCAYSAGSFPTGRVNPFALEQVDRVEKNCEVHSKSWTEFEGESAPPMDIVVTVCGNAVREVCPHFAGSPRHIHWGLPDPAAATGSLDDIREAFSTCFNVLQCRIRQLVRQMDEQCDSQQVIALMQELAPGQSPELLENNHEY